MRFSNTLLDEIAYPSELSTPYGEFCYALFVDTNLENVEEGKASFQELHEAAKEAAIKAETEALSNPETAKSAKEHPGPQPYTTSEDIIQRWLSEGLDEFEVYERARSIGIDFHLEVEDRVIPRKSKRRPEPDNGLDPRSEARRRRRETKRARTPGGAFSRSFSDLVKDEEDCNTFRSKVDWSTVPGHPFFFAPFLSTAPDSTERLDLREGTATEKALRYLSTSMLQTSIYEDHYLENRINPKDEDATRKEAFAALASLGIGDQFFVSKGKIREPGFYPDKDDASKYILPTRGESKRLFDAHLAVVDSEQYIAMPLTYQGSNGRLYSSSLDVDIDYPIFNDELLSRIIDFSLPRKLANPETPEREKLATLEALDLDLLERLLTAYSYFDSIDGFDPVIEVDPKTMKPHFTVWSPVIDSLSASLLSREIAEAFFPGYYDPSIYETETKYRTLSRPGNVTKDGSSRRAIILGPDPGSLIDSRYLANTGNVEIDRHFFKYGLSYSAFLDYADSTLLDTSLSDSSKIPERRKSPSLLRDFSNEYLTTGGRSPKVRRFDLLQLQRFASDSAMYGHSEDVVVSTSDRKADSRLVALGSELLYLLSTPKEELSFLGLKGDVGEFTGVYTVSKILADYKRFHVDSTDRPLYNELLPTVSREVRSSPKIQELSLSNDCLKKVSRCLTYSIIYSRDRRVYSEAYISDGVLFDNYAYLGNDYVPSYGRHRGFSRSDSASLYLHQAKITGFDPVAELLNRGERELPLSYLARVNGTKDEGIYKALESGAYEAALQMASYPFTPLSSVVKSRKPDKSISTRRVIEETLKEDDTFFSRNGIDLGTSGIVPPSKKEMAKARETKNREKLTRALDHVSLPSANVRDSLALVSELYGPGYDSRTESYGKVLSLTKVILGSNTPGLRTIEDIAKAISKNSGDPSSGNLAALKGTLVSHIHGLSRTEGGKAKRGSFGYKNLSKVLDLTNEEVTETSTTPISGELLSAEFDYITKDMTTRSSASVLSESRSNRLRFSSGVEEPEKNDSLAPKVVAGKFIEVEGRSVEFSRESLSTKTELSKALVLGKGITLDLLGNPGEEFTKTESALRDDLGAPLTDAEYASIFALIAFGLPNKTASFDAALKLTDGINTFHRYSQGKSKQLSSRYLSTLSGVSAPVAANAIRILANSGLLERAGGKLKGTLLGKPGTSEYEAALFACGKRFGIGIFGEERATKESFVDSGEFASIYTRLNPKREVYGDSGRPISISSLYESLISGSISSLVDVLTLAYSITALETHLDSKGGVKDEYDRERRNFLREDLSDVLEAKLASYEGKRLADAVTEAIRLSSVALDAINPVLTYVSSFYEGRGARTRKKVAYVALKAAKVDNLSISSISSSALLEGVSPEDVRLSIEFMERFGLVRIGGDYVLYRPNPLNRYYLQEMTKWEEKKERFRVISRAFRETYRVQCMPERKTERPKCRSTFTPERSFSKGSPVPIRV